MSFSVTTVKSEDEWILSYTMEDEIHELDRFREKPDVKVTTDNLVWYVEAQKLVYYLVKDQVKKFSVIIDEPPDHDLKEILPINIAEKYLAVVTYCDGGSPMGDGILAMRIYSFEPPLDSLPYCKYLIYQTPFFCKNLASVIMVGFNHYNSDREIWRITVGWTANNVIMMRNVYFSPPSFEVGKVFSLIEAESFNFKESEETLLVYYEFKGAKNKAIFNYSGTKLS